MDNEFLSSTDTKVLEWVKQAFGLDPVNDEWTRILIDIRPGDLVMVYIEKPGTIKMLQFDPLVLKKAKIEIV